MVTQHKIKNSCVLVYVLWVKCLSTSSTHISRHCYFWLPFFYFFCRPHSKYISREFYNLDGCRLSPHIEEQEQDHGSKDADECHQTLLQVKLISSNTRIFDPEKNYPNYMTYERHKTIKLSLKVCSFRNYIVRTAQK